MDLPRRCPHSSALHSSGGLLPVAMATEFHSSKVNDLKKKKKNCVRSHFCPCKFSSRLSRQATYLIHKILVKQMWVQTCLKTHHALALVMVLIGFLACSVKKDETLYQYDQREILCVIPVLANEWH